jgi:uncharacterized membrane protein YfcA
MDPVAVAAGALTGLVVGMTGVGGGALMTPLLLLVLGTAPLTAVGTDLWFAAITKVAVVGLHLRARVIDWDVVRRLWAGSLPASLLTLVVMAGRPADESVLSLVRGAIGLAVMVTAVSLLVSGRRPAATRNPALPASRERLLTIGAGAALGLLVTLTSVGAGALGVVCLNYLYGRRLTTTQLVATDIAHAIPLALCAGLGHLVIGHVDVGLLRDLLIGSVPAALAGGTLSARVSTSWLGRAVGAVLLVIGLLMLRPLIDAG